MLKIKWILKDLDLHVLRLIEIEKTPSQLILMANRIGSDFYSE